MDKRYPPGVSFMSRTTFTAFIFSWMANFNIDFREVCSQCGHNPPVLACDGTKIGIPLRNAKFSAIETPTCDVVIDTQHNITKRNFFSYATADMAEVKNKKRSAQNQLQYFVAKNSATLKEWKARQKQPVEELDKVTEEQRKVELLEHTPEACKEMMRKFIYSTYPQDLLQALCPILKTLSSTCPLTSLVNYRFLEPLSKILQNSTNLNIVGLKPELPQICHLLHVAHRLGEMASITAFLKDIIDRIKTIHQSDREPEEPSVRELYNPEEQGRAYYFTQHGGRVRDMATYRNFDKGSNSKSDCRKVYDVTAQTGTTFLFLWFDPLHGHCYGFHSIPSSEGRKDPFSSAYLYMDLPPKEIFYDFSCQLEEYCLNREPKFWRGCRFYHDIFHGFSHKCSSVYNSGTVPALNIGINSEICEQFNSFIQMIKKSASHMSQTHFIFFLQFLIHRWNEDKRKSLIKEQQMAHALMM